MNNKNAWVLRPIRLGSKEGLKMVANFGPQNQKDGDWLIILNYPAHVPYSCDSTFVSRLRGASERLAS